MNQSLQSVVGHIIDAIFRATIVKQEVAKNLPGAGQARLGGMIIMGITQCKTNEQGR